MRLTRSSKLTICRIGLGEEYLRVIEAALDSLQQLPFRCRFIDDDIRRFILRRFPYALFYAVEEDNVVILACYHVRRDPAVWPRSNRN